MFRLFTRPMRPGLRNMAVGNKKFLSYQSVPLIHEMLISMYAAFDLAIQDGIRNAEFQNKKLLIAAGEKHDEPDCMLAGILLLSIAAKYLINTLCVEYTPNSLNRELKSKKLEMDRYGYDYFTPDEPIFNDHVKTGILEAYLLQQTQSPMQIMAVDDPHIDCIPLTETITPETMTKRDVHIVNQLVQNNDHLVSVFGLSHLSGIMSNQDLVQKYHVIGINITNLNTVNAMLEKCLANTADDYMAKRLQFVTSNRHVLQIAPNRLTSCNPLLIKSEVEMTMRLCHEKHCEHDRSTQRRK